MAAQPTTPNLLNLENKTRQQPKIAHEQGAGSQCIRCGPKCSGFDLHYWRKICRNCRCGKENHLVEEEEDPSSRVVRLLDHPHVPSGDNRPATLNVQKTGRAAVTDPQDGPSSPLDWMPPSADSQLAVKYMEQLPAGRQPVTGSQAAVDRKRALDRQLPSHDLDPDQCQSLSVNEKKKMEEYVNNVKQFVVGQGLIQECPPQRISGKLPLPPPQLDRILGEKVGQLNLQTQTKPFQQFITAKPFKMAANDDVKRMSEAKPNASGGSIGDRHFDHLPPPPPDMLADPSIGGDVTPPPPPPPPLPHPESHPAKKNEDPVRDFFDFLDEQEGKKLPGKIQSPFLHPNRPAGGGGGAAKMSPSVSPNLNQRSFQGLVTAVPATTSVRAPPSNGQAMPPRRLLTTDFDYVPPPTQNSSSPVINNNNQEPPSGCALHPFNENNNKYHQQQLEVFQEPEQNWSCRKCSQIIQAGTVAIFAERAGSDKCWHPQCFVCSICDEMLADLIYFFVDEQMFCGRHYAEQMKIPRCKACDELIFAPEYTSAEGASWHMNHFCCWLCDTPLAGHQYTPIDGQPHCLHCYQKKYGKDCYECGRPIRAEETRVSHGEMNWHNSAECFKCRQCQTAMINRQFILKNGQIYCSRQCVVQHAQCLAQPVVV